ncbi:flagellar protein [Paenibacillus sp. y28]|uniref:flagellar protein n=1 Tax=Paenibacillus sp. y28 TaxID=3129110 RepID=UPI0030193356
MTMIELRVDHCSSCGKVYQRNVRQLCQDCIHQADSNLDKCLSFLRRDKKASSQSLSDHTGVPIKEITRFLREGKILIVDFPNLTYACASCGGPIRQHKLCSPCSEWLSRDIRNMFEAERKAAANSGTGFHMKERYIR